MNLIYKITLLLFACLTIDACIDPLKVDIQDSQQILVVEGGISTLPGRHRILLTKSDKYGSVLDGFIRKQTGATVWVRDEEGNQTFFEELEEGNYYTPPTFQALIGRKYTLLITLANGERYVSTPEQVLPAPPIDSLTVLFKRQPVLNGAVQETGIEIYAQWKDPEDASNYYLWETEGIHILNTQPSLYVGRDGQGNPVPAPKDCCERCYQYEPDINTVIRIFKDNFTNGKNNAELAVYIPDDGKRFMEKYMAIVKQYSLTKEAFQFYDLLKNQLSIQGDIFDPPPATIRGNMINLDNPDEEVIGYFRASDVATDTIYILRDDLEEPKPIKQIFDDCRVFKGATTERPPFWN